MNQTIFILTSSWAPKNNNTPSCISLTYNAHLFQFKCTTLYFHYIHCFWSTKLIFKFTKLVKSLFTVYWCWYCRVPLGLLQSHTLCYKIRLMLACRSTRSNSTSRYCLLTGYICVGFGCCQQSIIKILHTI